LLNTNVHSEFCLYVYIWHIAVTVSAALACSA
jgi:hypothetical protein